MVTTRITPTRHFRATAATDAALHSTIDRVAGLRKTPGLQVVVVDPSDIRGSVSPPVRTSLIPISELGFAVEGAKEHAGGYLETYPLMNLFKRLLIDPESILTYSGRWLRICDHCVNGPAFGGHVGTARGFAAFLQTSSRTTPCSSAMRLVMAKATAFDVNGLLDTVARAILGG